MEVKTREIVDSFVGVSYPPHRITSIHFGVFSSEQMQRLSNVHVVEKDIYHPHTRDPFPGGVLDPRMGVSSKALTCRTCGLSLADCPGHFGFLRLELPCFHVGFFRSIIDVLQRVCKSCSRILLTPEEMAKFGLKINGVRGDHLRRAAMTKVIAEECKKKRICPHCGSANGSVKKVGPLKLLHEKYKVKGFEDGADAFVQSFEEAITHNKEVAQYLPRAQEDLNPLHVLRLFKNITHEDCDYLYLDPCVSHPSRLILTHLLLPPSCIRPSVVSDTLAGSNEDDLTMKLTEILRVNHDIRINVEKGAGPSTVMGDWDHLQMQVAMYINSDLPGFPASATQGKPIRSLCTRLKGKRGRFRGNLSGKRVDFSGRTVISPDPNVEVDEVVVPILVAKTLTYPERVSRYNLRPMRRAVRNGPDHHPGANFVESRSGVKCFLKYADRKEVARRLRPGDIVERHLVDGDYVLFNRQPSLHRVSIMAHRARILPHRTFRFNVCACAPYNADFDGDEMNLHVPQTEEARAEAAELMGLLKNIVTVKAGEAIIAATQDFLTGAYLITHKDTFFDRGEFCQLIAHMNVECNRLPPPAILRPMELWTGKQIFGVLLAPNAHSKGSSSSKWKEPILNFEAPNKSYSKEGMHMCKRDGYVCFYNSELISGFLDKSILGGGSKNGLFYLLVRLQSPDYSAECMLRLARLTSRFVMNRGFSIGVEDVRADSSVMEGRQAIIDEGYKECLEMIRAYENGKLDPQPGCTVEETLEAVLNGRLSELRESCGKLCVRMLPWRNAPLTMATCGSKGSNINISQMVACVGQQTVNGSRIENDFVDRPLPHFDLHSKTPEAKGFVENSFYSGLKATEFFFHTMAGREGLVDTAVKTAETGYMQRRLMKALEDASVQYDATVRNSENRVVQFSYGDDGLDPLEMESSDGHLLALPRMMLHVIRGVPWDGGDESGNVPKRSALPCEIRSLVAKIIGGENETPKSNLTLKIHGLIWEFVEKCIRELVDVRDKLSLPLCDEILEPIDLDQIRTMIDPENDFENVIFRSGYASLHQWHAFVDECLKRYEKARIEPGEAVGALAAQSLGEPTTQMTLKTFHFAGVASMNVTLGVPRIKEIINASKTISTPIITAELVASRSEQAARIVKGRIEKTLLGQVCQAIEEVYEPGQCYISIDLDMTAIGNLQLGIGASDVRHSILATRKLKLKDKFVRVYGESHLRVFPTDVGREGMMKNLQNLKNGLPLVIVKGLATVNRAVINKKSDGSLNLLVEGTDLRRVMTTPGIIPSKTWSNHILEIETTLGIEATRSMIMSEIRYVMSSYGMKVDERHILLLADAMTFKGQVLGITRFGIAKMKDSVLMLASFEKTTDHLFDAALRARKDPILGVSECIITGTPIPVGTGSFRLLQEYPFSFFPNQNSLIH
eukprot:TRINITY_DN1537_c0_g1_i1.p1 TRINITY_DN1537_c0_g1~~TRINITY_DN1537_c0_g1_i1.p1  ORF type:complete len:1415 (+),score=363.19 TRINITY_DN1537_c0_g1_i1:100-4344(+)